VAAPEYRALQQEVGELQRLLLGEKDFGERDPASSAGSGAAKKRLSRAFREGDLQRAAVDLVIQQAGSLVIGWA